MFLGGDLFGCDTSATPWADGDAAGSNDRPDESGRLHGAPAFSEGMHRGAENTGNRPEELVRLHVVLKKELVRLLPEQMLLVLLQGTLLMV